MSKEQKREVMTSPVGTAVWPHLSGDPDMKYAKDGHGHYKTGLRLKRTDPGVAEFLEALEQRHKGAMEATREKYKEYCLKAKENGKKPKPQLAGEAPWKDEVDKEGNETGCVIINFKMKASGVSKKTNKPWKRKPMLFDSQGAEITRAVNVGGGSRIKVSFELSQFWTAMVGASISLRLEGVQILDLKEFRKKSAAELGFGKEEGYEFDSATDEDASEPESDDAPVQTGGGDDSADFE